MVESGKKKMDRSGLKNKLFKKGVRRCGGGGGERRRTDRERMLVNT